MLLKQRLYGAYILQNVNVRKDIKRLKRQSRLVNQIYDPRLDLVEEKQKAKKDTTGITDKSTTCTIDPQTIPMLNFLNFLYYDYMKKLTCSEETDI